MWVGEKHYPTPSAFIGEALKMGISKRIGAVPRHFRLGKSVIYLAHRKAIWESDTKQLPAIFGSFVPTSIDGVVEDPENIPEKAEKLKSKYGDRFRLVKIIPKGENDESEPE